MGKTKAKVGVTMLRWTLVFMRGWHKAFGWLPWMRKYREVDTETIKQFANLLDEIGSHMRDTGEIPQSLLTEMAEAADANRAAHGKSPEAVEHLHKQLARERLKPKGEDGATAHGS